MNKRNMEKRGEKEREKENRKWQEIEEKWKKVQKRGGNAADRRGGEMMTRERRKRGVERKGKERGSRTRSGEPLHV